MDLKTEKGVAIERSGRRRRGRKRVLTRSRRVSRPRTAVPQGWLITGAAGAEFRLSIKQQ